MDAILIVKSLSLATALRQNTSHPLAADILIQLFRHDARIEPYEGVAGVNSLVLHFRVIVTDDKRDKLLAALRKLPSVDWVGIKSKLETA